MTADQQFVLVTVRNVCRELLRVDTLEDDANLHALGANSLTMGRVVAELRRLGVPASMGAAMRNPSVRGLVASAAAVTPTVAASEATEARLYPPTPPQWAFFSAFKNVDEDVQHVRLEFAAGVSAEVADRAFRTVFDRHEAFRTEFVQVDGEWKVRVADRRALTIESAAEDDLPGASGDRIRVPITAAPLMKVFAIDRPGPVTLHLMVHHLIFDHEGFEAFINDIDHFVRVESQGLDRPAPPSNFTAWLNWLEAQRTRLATPDNARAWLDFGGDNQADVPNDHTLGENRLENTRTMTALIDGPELAQLRAATEPHTGTTMEATILSALLYECARQYGLDRVRCQLSRSSRSHTMGGPDVADLMAWLVHAFPIQVSSEHLHTSFDEFAHHLGRRLAEPPAHEISHALMLSSTTTDPLVRRVQEVPRPLTSFIFAGEPDAASRPRTMVHEVECPTRPRQLTSSARNVVFQMTAGIETDGLVVGIRYSPNLHREAGVRSWIEATAARLRDFGSNAGFNR